MSINSGATISALAIRDTSAQTGSVIDNGDFLIKTIVIENSLNQTVTFQCQGSAHSDFSNMFNIGSTWDVAASTNTYMTCDNYFPFWRVIAQCSVAPTSGTLTVLALGVT